MRNNEDEMISIMMREVFPGRNKTKEREMGWACSSNGVATLNTRNPGTLIAGRVLDEAGGVGSSASGLPVTRVTCRKEREKGDEDENEREIPLVQGCAIMIESPI